MRIAFSVVAILLLFLSKNPFVNIKNVTHIIPFKNLRLFMRALLPLIKEGVHLALFKRV